MQNTSLINVLRSIDKNEMKEFEKFVSTSFFVKRTKVKELFRALKKYHPDFTSPEINKAKLYTILFPGEEYSDTLMRKIISELYKSVEKYFAYTNFINDDFSTKHHLIKEINKRGLNKETAVNIRAAFSGMNKRPERDEDYFIKKDLLLKEEGWLLTNDFHKLYENVQQTYEADCNFFVLTVLRYYLKLLNGNLYSKSGSKVDFIEEVFLSLEGSRYLEMPGIAVYYYAIKSYLDIDDLESLTKFRDLLFKHGKQIGREAEQALYNVLVTYCLTRSDLGKKEFLTEAHNVQKKQLEKGFCFVRGYFLPMYMDYIAMIALDLGKIDFTEKFINKYKDHLPPSDRENILNYNYSRLAQYKGEHEKALEQISKLGHRDLTRGTSIRILTLQIYFDLGMIDPALHQIDSFRHYLSGSNKFNQEMQDRAKRMLSILQQLLKIKSGSSRISLSDVKRTALEKKDIMKRYWIMDKIEEMEKTQ